MASTRDQVDAYGHESRRQVATLLTGEEFSGTDPRRRLNRSLLGGGVLGVLLLAVSGVVGFLSGASGVALPDSGAVVVKGSGDPYVVVGGVLHPALNLSSALLVGGGKVTTVSQSVVDKAPHGLPVGIPGAPDALPGAKSVKAGTWTVCEVAPESQSAKATVTVLIGPQAPRSISSSQAVMVADPGGGQWLVTAGRRYAVPQESAAILGLTSESSVLLSAAVLNTIPAGAPLVAPSILSAGSQTAISLPFDAVIGDVVEADIATDKRSYFVVVADGLVPISPLAYTLLAAQAAHHLTESPSVATSVLSSAASPVSKTWPQTIPTLVQPQRGGPLCTSFDPSAPPGDPAWPVSISLPATVPVPAGAKPIVAALPSVTTAIVVSGSQGDLVKSSTSAGSDGVYTLITSAGVAFPISNATDVKRLGYSTSDAAVVPMPFVALLPSGPTLDSTAAALEYTNAPAASSSAADSSSAASPSGP